MNAKDYLNKAREAEKALRVLRMEREHILAVATGIQGQTGSPVQSSPGSRVENAAIRLADLEEKMEGQKAEYLRICQEAREKIGRIKRIRYREVLTLRYLCGLSWKSVSDRMGYQDEKSVFRVHGYALQEMQRILNGG